MMSLLVPTVVLRDQFPSAGLEAELVALVHDAGERQIGALGLQLGFRNGGSAVVFGLFEFGFGGGSFGLRLAQFLVFLRFFLFVL